MAQWLKRRITVASKSVVSMQFCAGFLASAGTNLAIGRSLAEALQLAVVYAVAFSATTAVRAAFRRQGRPRASADR